MTTVENDLRADWARWHAGRERELGEPYGWLSLTALEWLDATARTVAGLPGTWRVAPAGGAVELTAAAAAGLTIDGGPVAGTQRNRAVNLPCAFTAYATCPLPPAENRLPLAVAAGEQSPA